MAKSSEFPERLRPYVFHGVDLTVQGKEGVGDCPFCGAGKKFYVAVEDGKANCRRCGVGSGKGGMNESSFLSLLWERSLKGTAESAYKDLAASRGLVLPSTPKAWGACKSLIDGTWLVPGHGVDGKLKQLYRWVMIDGGKRLLATPGQHALHGLHLWDDKKKDVYVCEGPWDGMALWETLGVTKRSGDTYSFSSVGSVSLGAKGNVVAVPGANTFLPYWLPLFAGRRVTFLYDNDHERTGKDGRTVPSTGFNGMRRACATLLSLRNPPPEVRYLHWGEAGYDPDLPNGHDVRDLLGAGKSLASRAVTAGSILGRTVVAPAEWATDGSAALDVDRAVECGAWEELTDQWKKALRWTEGLDRALSVMLASAASTHMIGDQLWIQVISPPSTGKTQLCDALGTSKRYVKGVGNFTGLHSGFQTDGEAKEDHSLLIQLKDKTFVVKDGDTVLKSPNRERILSQIRDAYDTNCAVAYGNRVKREYENLRFTFILCGTEALLEMDSADLGARFLVCVIMDKIDKDLETEINRRGFYRVFNNRGVVANGKPESQDDPELVKAKAMTGGYVSHLRNNAHKALEALQCDDPDAVAAQIDLYAQFIAHLRARPSKTQTEVTTREMSTRLNNQLSKLTLCLAVVLNRQIDAEVMRRVRQVVLDTARGRTLDLVKHLSGEKPSREGVLPEVLSARTGREEDDVRRDLRFLQRIGVCEPFTQKTAVVLPSGASVSFGEAKGRWRMTPRFLDLYNTVTTMTTK